MSASLIFRSFDLSIFRSFDLSIFRFFDFSIFRFFSGMSGLTKLPGQPKITASYWISCYVSFWLNFESRKQSIRFHKQEMHHFHFFDALKLQNLAIFWFLSKNKGHWSTKTSVTDLSTPPCSEWFLLPDHSQIVIPGCHQNYEKRISWSVGMRMPNPL